MYINNLKQLTCQTLVAGEGSTLKPNSHFSGDLFTTIYATVASTAPSCCTAIPDHFTYRVNKQSHVYNNDGKTNKVLCNSLGKGSGIKV